MQLVQQRSATAAAAAAAAPQSRRRSVIVRADGAVGAKVERWLKTPFDIATFGARFAAGALVSLPERLQTLPTDLERAATLVQDPRPVEEKQHLVLAEVEDTLVTLLERGATLEADVLGNVKALLPPDVAKTLDELIPPSPQQQEQQQQQQGWGAQGSSGSSSGGSNGAVEDPTVVYTADAVLESQIAAEMAGVKDAVAGVKAALEALRANADPARAAMLRTNLREARDVLSRRLQETAPGVAPAGTGADTALAAATREARVLLDEVDAQFFAASAGY